MITHRVNNMAKTAAWNLARTNVRVNSICPGLIEVRGALSPCVQRGFYLVNEDGTYTYRSQAVGTMNPLPYSPLSPRFWFGKVGCAAESIGPFLGLLSHHSSHPFTLFVLPLFLVC